MVPLTFYSWKKWALSSLLAAPLRAETREQHSLPEARVGGIVVRWLVYLCVTCESIHLDASTRQIISFNIGRFQC